MSAPVRIEAEAWTDLRFATLARILALADADHALIRTARIWSWQAEHYTPEAPTYVVDLDTIESALGTGGGAALVRARLAEEAPGGYRIRGANGRIEWLWQKRQAARAGGEATKRKHGNKQGPHGPPHGEPAAEPTLSPLVPALVPDRPEDQNSPSACAIPPAVPQPVPASVPAVSPPAVASMIRPAVEATLRANPPPAPTPSDRPFDAADPRAIGRLAEATYRRVSDALLQVAAELRLPAPLPFPAITPASSERTRDARDRVREEGPDAPAVCDRIVANLIAQAREERTVEWLAEKAFTPGGWRTARAWMPGAAARRRGPVRGDPLPPAPAPKRPDPPPPDRPLSPEDRAEILALAARVGVDPEAAAAAELAGRPSSLATADLVRRFGEGPAPPDTPDAIADEPRKQPKSRKAAT